jgi:hypothetical protein
MFSVGVISPSWLNTILERQELTLSPLHDLALSRIHDEDWLGINGISGIHLPQNGYP